MISVIANPLVNRSLAVGEMAKGFYQVYIPPFLKKQKFKIEYTEIQPATPLSTQEVLTTPIIYQLMAPTTTKVTVQMVFDAVLRTEHLNSRQITSHPVNNQANISDHSYKIPATLTMDVGVSDVMYNFNPVNIIMSDSNSRSVNAFQKLNELADLGEPLTVYTRLKTYKNMVIESVRAREDYKSITEMRATINFQQIQIASGVRIAPVSAEAFTVPDKTESTDQPIDFNATNAGAIKSFLMGSVKLFSMNY